MKAKKKRRSNRVASNDGLEGMVSPKANAFMYLLDHGPFRLRFYKTKDNYDWCDVYKGKKKVWSCNAIFARTHFMPSNGGG